MDRKVTITNAEGKSVVGDIVTIIRINDLNSDYVVYTFNQKDETGNIEVYASIYYPNDPHSKLEAIETEKEWKVIETILETLQEEVRNKMNKEKKNWLFFPFEFVSMNGESQIESEKLGQGILKVLFL